MEHNRPEGPWDQLFDRLKKLNKLEDKLEKKAQRFNWNDEQQLKN